MSPLILRKKKKILICPLDWGLGHATRCVPIIRKLLNYDIEVILAADNRPLSFLEQEFPELIIIKFPGLNIQYPSNSSMSLKMLQMYPKIKKSIRNDNEWVKNTMEKYKIDAVISDNRFGCWNSEKPSVYISHQLMIKTPKTLKALEPILYKWHRGIIKKYNFCWIPDYNDSRSLSGDLANKYPVSKNYQYIGPLSRIKETNNSKEALFDILCIISGPEPYNEQLYTLLTNSLSKLPLKCGIIRGKTENSKLKTEIDNLKIYNHVGSDKLSEFISRSDIIICRSGYSSIMDIASIGKPAILIPTPGQTEQIYLAHYHKMKNHYYCEQQKDFDILRSVEEVSYYKPPKISGSDKLLSNTIKGFIKIIP